VIFNIEDPVLMNTNLYWGDCEMWGLSIGSLILYISDFQDAILLIAKNIF